jgi:hypothetical protein
LVLKTTDVIGSQWDSAARLLARVELTFGRGNQETARIPPRSARIETMTPRRLLTVIREMGRLFLWAIAFSLVMPAKSQAHIKWFCAYDTTVPPLPIGDVVTPTFTAIALLFSILMFIAYVVDRSINESSWARRLDDRIFRSEPYTSVLIRAAVGILFLVLWESGGIILTPELKTNNALIPQLQLAIAASMLFRSTLRPGALGIMVLYAYAAGEYGAFHLMDYPIFPGIAAYLSLIGVKNSFLSTLRLPVLYAGVSATMMWGAIEKFGYPYWTFPLLTTHSGLTLGMGFDQFMYVAGFVEFSLAFFVLTGTALLRCSCAVLLMLLAAAVPEFGKIDAVGHLVIIAGLITMIIAGQRIIQLPLVLARSGILAQAGILTLAYSAAIVTFFVLYYGSQFLAGR